MMESYHFEFLPLEGQVDKKEGVIRDVSVITAGVEARGHKLKSGEGLHTDMRTLKEMKAVGNEMVQVPVKWNHRTGADAVNGYLTNFRIRGQKLIGDWVLLKTHERYKHALEIAEKMPRGVGLSASFMGKSEVKGGKAFARCRELKSVDLVANPAANPDGLFEEVCSAMDAEDRAARSESAPYRGDGCGDGCGALFEDAGEGVAGVLVDMLGEVMSENSKTPGSGEDKVDLDAVMGAIKDLGARVGERLDALEEFHQEVSEAIDAEEAEFAAGQEEAGVEGHDLQGGEDAVSYFERRLSEAEAERDAAEREREFAEHAEKVERLIALNQQLAAENQAMAGALHELSDGTAAFSAPGDNGEVRVVIPELGADGGELTDFEARVRELKEGGKDDAEAITFAIEESEERYTQHLEEKGALA